MAHDFNGPYSGHNLDRVAFPLGGIGAGMFCIEGSGAFSHFSLRHRPEIDHEPCVFSALCIKENLARVLEGPVPAWKAFGPPGTGNGATGKTYGLPRFAAAEFAARFPFARVALSDPDLPLDVRICAWSPFVPGCADDSSLPLAAVEYTFTNASGRPVDAVYSFNAKNFMEVDPSRSAIEGLEKGFSLQQPPFGGEPWHQGEFSAEVDSPDVKKNLCWFRGGWFDELTVAWKDVAEGAWYDRRAAGEMEMPSHGASLFVPLSLEPGGQSTIRLRLSWYVPHSNLRAGKDPEGRELTGAYQPWYAVKFRSAESLRRYWQENMGRLRNESQAFSDCFYDSSLPPEVLEAAGANLSILKSPTVLRQADGRLWCWRGVATGSVAAMAVARTSGTTPRPSPSPFPDLERSLRRTEFHECQAGSGHQAFRANLPISPTEHSFHSAADGQLGGVLKVYRDWRVSGDTGWLRELWPKVRQSLDYCIATWDPDESGALFEPHHNTYDIEFWGPDGMCGSFYLAALKAAGLIGRALGDDVSRYESLFEKGKVFLETELFNGQYFFQKVQWQGLRAGSAESSQSLHDGYSREALELLAEEGPKYQYGNGCLADGILGEWMARVCGVGAVLDASKVQSHLESVHRHNLKQDLSGHANPQRPGFAYGTDGGLLLCTWPNGGRLTLPFVYSDEVWTGIEYQVASHLMMAGLLKEGLEVVRTARRRYDGTIRNPFNEYECGHWYARALSSYALLYGMSGARYDAVERVLYIRPHLAGDFRCFISTATGFGTVGLRNGEAFVEIKQGNIDIQRIEYTPCASI